MDKGEYDASLEEIGQKAYELYMSMEKKINKIISKVLNYNKASEFDDYKSEAYAACHEAVLLYNAYLKTKDYSSISLINEEIEEFQRLTKSTTKMKLETFSYWYIMKKIYSEADCGLVRWHIFDSDGILKNDLSEQEWRKHKKKLLAEGFTGEPYSVFVDLKDCNGESIDAGDLADVKTFNTPVDVYKVMSLGLVG